MRTFLGRLPKLSRLQWALLLLAGFAVLFGVFLRTWKLGYPADKIFDEVYFPVFAQKYLTGADVFDVHPPLGKLIIAVSMLFLGDNPIGWRMAPLLAGLALIPASAWLTLRLSQSRVAALLVGASVAVDMAFTTYSRTGLMDGMLVLACVSVLLAASSRRLPVWVPALLLGVAGSIKWVGLAVALPAAYIFWRQKRFLQACAWLPLTVVVVFLSAALGESLDGAQDVLKATVNWHQQAFNYHATLTATHPWSSTWDTWPFQLRPTLFWYQDNGGKGIELMTTLGNPVLWTGGFLAIAAGIGRVLRQTLQKTKVDHYMVVLILGWIGAYLPFIGVERVMFHYHYLPASLFGTMALCWWLSLAWYEGKKWVTVAMLALIVAVGVWLAPHAAPWWRMTRAQLDQRIWLKTWLWDTRVQSFPELWSK